MTVIRHTYAPLFDDTEFTRRIVHDQQFMDLSERYDPLEPSPETEPANVFTRQEWALIIVAWACALAVWIF